MYLDKKICEAQGLGANERAQLRTLLNVYSAHQHGNRIKRRYYEGHVTLGEVNLGLALPHGMRGLEIGCAWGEKAVDVLAARSMFDGFVGSDGSDAEGMTRIMKVNNMKPAYSRACRDQLKYGCTFATLSADPRLGCRIRWHTPETAAAVWNGEKERIGYGMAIIDTEQDPLRGGEWRPKIINLYTDRAVWTLRASPSGSWIAQEFRHKLGRPMMEPLVWNGTSAKPFGRSRLKKPVRELIRGYVSTVANATIGLEFSTTPQKYLLGVSDAQYDAIINDKFKAYVGSILSATSDPETKEKPTFGQLAQGTIQPHVDMLRVLSTQFSAATGLTVTDVGVINDANPTSSDAIMAQSQTLVLLAEQLNEGNAAALYNIAIMAQAIARNVTPEELTEEETGIIARFKNPAMPSVAITADAAVKIASARPSFANTDNFLEMMGFSNADIRRIRAQESRARGLAVFQSLEEGGEK